MKKIYTVFFVLLPLFCGCVQNPFTGERTLALVPNALLFPSAFGQYQTFLNENTVVTGTPQAEMVARVGDKIKRAAQEWVKSEGSPQYLKDYSWEYKLVQSSEINAWCMPGGKIVVYTGILPVTKDEQGLAVVMGHEVAHALLNHGQQRMSASVLQQLGALAVATLAYLLSDEQDEKTQDLAMTIYGAGSTLFGTLPFSRKHESEADHYGLILMAIAGYNPDAAVPFWQRMPGGSGLEFLSTHPDHGTRIKDLRGWVSEAKKKADKINRNN